MDTETDADRSATATDHSGLRGWLSRNRGLAVAGAVVAAALLAFVLWWFQPQALLFDTVVDEDFPTVDPSANEPMDDAEPMDEADALDETDAMDEEAAPDGEPMDEGDTTGDADAMDDADPMDDSEAMEGGDASDEAAAPTEPLALSSGTFSSRNRYTVTGEATAFELPDGSRVLRLEDFESTNGPDLFVYLTAANSDASDAELDDDAVNLGVLTGNIGNQNYDIPAEVDLDHYDTVVIWCRRFTTSFGVADLS